MDALSAALADQPEWKYENDEPIAWTRLPPWALTEDPLNLGPALKVDLLDQDYPEGVDTSALKCLWRMRYVLVKEDDDGSDWWADGWRRYGAFESFLNDVVIPWHTQTTTSTYRPLWLFRGGMAEKWWACLDLNQSLGTPGGDPAPLRCGHEPGPVRGSPRRPGPYARPARCARTSPRRDSPSSTEHTRQAIRRCRRRYRRVRNR